MSINERILHLIKLKGYNKNSFSRKIGIKPQTLHHIISGRKTKPSFNVIEKIVSTFVDINAKWLITGLGKPIVDKQTEKYNISCSKCKYLDNKFSEMAKDIDDLKQQIAELQKDKEDLRAVLKRFKTKFNDNGC